MRKIISWFWLSMKAFIQNKIFICLSIAMVTLCFLLGAIELDSGSVVGVCYSGEEPTDVLMSKLNEQGEYYLYNQVDEIQRDVLNGTLCCGFIIEDDYVDYIINNKKGKPITVIAKPGYVLAEVEKENIVSSILYVVSNHVIQDKSKDIFENADEALNDKLLELRDAYLKSDILFATDITYVETTMKDEVVKFIEVNIRGILAFIIFMTMLCVGTYKYDAKACLVTKAMGKKEKIEFNFIRLLASSVPFGILGLIMVPIITKSFFVMDIFKMIAFLVFSSIWVFLLGLISKKETTYVALCPVILVAQVIICPIVFDLSSLINNLDIIRYIFPISYFC